MELVPREPSVAARDVDDDVATECLDHVNRMVMRAAPFALPAALLLVVIIGEAVPIGRRLLWIGIVTTGTVLALLSAASYRSRRARGKRPKPAWTYLTASVIALCWSSIVWVAFPGAAYQEKRAIVLLFSIGVAMSAAVSSAASRARFFAYQSSFAVPLVTAYLASSDNTTRLLGLALPLFFAASVAIHKEVHGVVTREMQLRHQLRSANQQLSELALHDGLTGLYNRVAFMELLDVTLANAARSGEHIAVLYLDLDRFKWVNDALGHVAGDQLLVGVAQRLHHLVRSGDACARLGGDEFAIVLRSLREPEEAHEVAGRVREALARPFEWGTERIYSTASIGIARPLRPGATSLDVLRDADTAQYRAKQAGGDRVVEFDTTLRDELRRRVTLEGELRTAIDDGQIVAYFQPQLDLRSGRIVGAEALARWVHPTRGLIAAGEFVAPARALGLLDRIDMQVIEQAMRARVRLRELGVHPDFRLWLNVGARWIVRGDGQGMMATRLEATGCRPNELGIELTEDEVLRDFSCAAALLGTARHAGMQVALDDFGTGESSITLLRRLPIDVLKIDESFITDVAGDSGDRAIVSAMCDLARRLDILVSAEGIEMDAQLEALLEMGCERGQGFLFAPPLAFDELATAVRGTAGIVGVAAT